jgi:hypothetical protein
MLWALEISPVPSKLHFHGLAVPHTSILPVPDPEKLQLQCEILHQSDKSHNGKLPGVGVPDINGPALATIKSTKYSSNDFPSTAE